MSSRQPTNKDEEILAAKVGDFLKKVRMRGKKPSDRAPDAISDVIAEPSSGEMASKGQAAAAQAGTQALQDPGELSSTPAKKAKTDTKVSAAKSDVANSGPPVPAAVAAAPANGENQGSLSDEEHDLGTQEGCQNYILSCFSKGRRAEVAPVAAFYITTHLKPMCSKKVGLWEVFNKQVVGPRMLQGMSGRNSWLSAWKANREKRFAKVAKVMRWCRQIPQHIFNMCSPQALAIYSDMSPPMEIPRDDPKS